ncbi:MAG: DUF3806 domain-containing protein [Phycisphaerae bacterium]|nr:DUF3806 domain-containing protein [Phycisphaerae bacterium]
MRKIYSSPIVLAILCTIFFVVGLCLISLAGEERFPGGILPSLPEDHFVFELLGVIGMALSCFGATYSVFVFIRSVVSLFIRTDWSRGALLAAIALLASVGAWTAYRWPSVRSRGGYALFSNIEPISFDDIDSPYVPVIISHAIISEEPGQLIETMPWATSGPRFTFYGSSSRPAEADFPIVELKYPGRTKMVNLTADYGCIIDWPKDSKPVFYLFDRKRKSRLKTDSWERFLQEIKRLPKGAEIDQVGKCSVPFVWGMPHSKSKEFHQALDTGLIKVVSVEDDIMHTMFCYCETLDFRILHDDVRQTPTTQNNQPQPTNQPAERVSGEAVDRKERNMAPRFSPPSEADTDQLARQWLFVDGLVSKRYGASLDQSTNDLKLIQRLLNDKVLSRTQTWELQSLGVVLGRVLAHNTPGLDWWIIEDQYGRDPTIRYEKTTLCLNVLTMISKRVEDRHAVDVRHMYDSLIDRVRTLKDQVRQ